VGAGQPDAGVQAWVCFLVCAVTPLEALEERVMILVKINFNQRHHARIKDVEVVNLRFETRLFIIQIVAVVATSLEARTFVIGFGHLGLGVWDVSVKR
jgi:hypothetical protein